MDDLSHPTLTQAAPVIVGDNPGPEAVAEAVAEAETPEPEAISLMSGRQELATQLVAKLCHDFISPAGAIMSGLDLLEDP
ncbi:MAG: hypothetical protein ACXU8O_09630, partial [Asticcacaulis sp.]